MIDPISGLLGVRLIAAVICVLVINKWRYTQKNGRFLTLFGFVYRDRRPKLFKIILNLQVALAFGFGALSIWPEAILVYVQR